jgi:hypothetical protein
MKAVALATTLVFLSHFSFSQTQLSKYDSLKRVRVAGWSDMIFIFPPNYWDEKKREYIIRQVGENEFEKMKLFSDYRNIPCPFLVFCEDRDGSARKELDSLCAKFDKLNVYRIASYFHTDAKNQTVEWAILRVPYESNKEWDPDAKWDRVYFVVTNSLVSEIE